MCQRRYCLGLVMCYRPQGKTTVSGSIYVFMFMYSRVMGLRPRRGLVRCRECWSLVMKVEGPLIFTEKGL